MKLREWLNQELERTGIITKPEWAVEQAEVLLEALVKWLKKNEPYAGTTIAGYQAVLDDLPTEEGDLDQEGEEP